MEFFEENFLATVAIFVIGLVIVYFFIDKFSLDFGSWKPSLEKIEVQEEDSKKESPMAELFHLYNHDSEKQWLNWMNKQSRDIRNEAAAKLINHINNRPEKWGYLTLEVLNCLKGFKDHQVDSPIGVFISRTGSLWREYKSIPNYYQKAAEVLTAINPNYALEIFKDEFSKKSSTEISLEKKRILTHILPDLGYICKDLMVEILTSNFENNTIKSQALRECKTLDDEIKKSIYLETLVNLSHKYKELKRPLRLEDASLLEDLIEDSLSYIGKRDFHEALNSLLKKEAIAGNIMVALTKFLNKQSGQLTLIELLSLSKLRDNKQKDIKRLLAKRNDLDLNELNNIVLQDYITGLDETELRSPHFESEFPIPIFYSESYKEFKNLFFKSIDEDRNRTCDKNFGGVLVCGNEVMEKLYFCRALVAEKGWGFTYLDLETITDKNSYQNMHEEITNLNKPCMVYLKNPQILFDANQNLYKEKFAQMLTIQSLDSKVFLAGDVPLTYDQLSTKELKESIKTLCAKYFPFITEVNTKPIKTKQTLLESLLKSVSTHRFEKRRELFSEFMDLGKDKTTLEFIFLILHGFITMLLVFGRDVPYKNIQNLEDQFKNLNGEALPTNNFGEEDLEDEESNEIPSQLS